MSIAKNFLAAGEFDLCWLLLVQQPLAVDPGAPGLDVLLVSATALRAAQRPRLPCGDPNPYAVFGLDPAVPISRNPAFIQSFYRRASNLLNRCHPNDPCWPAFTEAARLVTDAWAFLSDPDLKAYLDSGFEAAATAAAPVPTAPQPALLPPPPRPQAEAAATAAAPVPTVHQPAPPPPHQPAPVDMGRGKRRKMPVKRMSL